MGLVNRKETPAVGHVLGSDVVSESGWRQLAFNGFKPPPPPTSHKSNYLTVGERFNWALLIVWCNYAHLSWYWRSQLVPSVYLRWDLVQFIWLYIRLCTSLREPLVPCSGISLLWFLRGLNFKETESLFSFHTNEGLCSVWREWTDTSLHQERHTLSQSPGTLFSPSLTCLLSHSLTHSSSLLVCLPLQLCSRSVIPNQGYMDPKG